MSVSSSRSLDTLIPRLHHHSATLTSRISNIHRQHPHTPKLSTPRPNNFTSVLSRKSNTAAREIIERSRLNSRLAVSAAPGARQFSTSTQSFSANTKAHLISPKYTARDQALHNRGSARTFSVLLHSSIGSWTTGIICGIFGSAVVYFFFPTSYLAPREQKDPVISLYCADSCNSPIRDQPDSMTGETLAGRPGTLTAEEEERLKEMWIAVAQVFGIIDAQEAKEAKENGSTIDGPTKSDTASTTKDKKTKKKKSLFSRKKHADDSASTTSADTTTHATTSSEDKYGQTKEFHDAIANMSPETLRAAFWSMVKHDHPDALLLRFLRARKWDVEKSLVMMVSTMRWRATEMKVDEDIMRNGEGAALEDEKTSADAAKKSLGHDFLAQMRMGKSFLHGTDKEGRPMCFVRARLHKQGEQSEESLERYTVFLIETARMVLNPPIDTACVFFDLSGFSLANMDYGPVKFMIKCFEANYPESLGVVIVHKAPWVFQGIWKIIRGWLDPVVASKVNFTNNVKDLEVYIEKSRILKELDGDEDWTYEYVEPTAGENDIMKDTETRDKLLASRALIYQEFEKVTLEWINASEGQNELKVERNDIANKLKEDYWQLDPYLRARSLYDRVGMLTPSGKVQFYPTTANGAKQVDTSADDID
ncbi:CRAL/TRIO domain-containing protein [Phlyctema vagabunda]|uniref:CRAL/TRIO domain-containing protein n=1 Tax=Phlyctema vagabunda TaxID=108571 RepID=A0ABR4PS50_9HELO